MNEKQEKIVNGIFIINYGNTFVCAGQFARKRGQRR